MIDYASRLNEAQLAAVTSGEGPVLVVAGAGSGKTRTIVYRLAWLREQGVDAEQMLLLTFTRKASREMLERAGLLLGGALGGVSGGTFHSFAYGALRRWQPAWLEGRPFTVMDSADIQAALKSCRESLKIARGDRSFPKSQSVASFISKARNKELPLEEVLRREAFHLLPHAARLEELARAYAAFKRENGLLDYDDLLFELEDLLARDGLPAASLRERFRHILVDEYQDTNLVQARIVRLLAGAPGGQTASVMAVGDEAQSIYAFRGANVRNILDFPRLFPGASVIRLEENYRSVRPVLAVANCLLGHAAESFHKSLFTRREGGASVRLLTPVSDMSQAALVTARVRELLNTYAPGEIAVLFRSGFHSYNLELALNQAGIPFRKYGGQRYAEAAHVKDALAFARLALNPLDLPAFARVAAMHAGVGPRTVERLYQTLRLGDGEQRRKALARYPELAADLDFVDSLRQQLGEPTLVLTRVIERYRPRLEARFPEDWPRRWQGLEEITQMAAGYDELDQFVADLALENGGEEEPGPDQAITLSTVHSAKGLEWEAVLLIDLVEDRFPSRHAMARPEDFEEERRLMYVACTRAREVLELYSPATIYSRAEHGSAHVAQSPFVRELRAGLGAEDLEEWQENFSGAMTRRGSQPKAAPRTLAATGDQAGGYCRHRIFGRGKIEKFIAPDKAQVNFPSFGHKVILCEYLIMED